MKARTPRCALLPAVGLLLIAVAGRLLDGAPPSIRPVEGIRRQTPQVVALTGGRIVVAPGRVIPQGTIVFRDGVITAVGARVKIPPDARIRRADGKTIYPGLIDAYSPISLGEASAAGVSYWNPMIRPERDAAHFYRVEKSLSAAFRSQGVTCRLVVPDSGVIKGTSALVTTGDGPAGQEVLEDHVALHMRLSVDRGSRGDAYPKSPMGAVALARQAMYDADWHRRARRAYLADPTLPRPERNDSLECLQGYAGSGRLVIIDAADEQYALRADRFAREFALRIAVRGSGREYRRLSAIRRTGRTVIVPLNFPDPPEVSTPEAARNVSLTRLMHWDIAPENPARLVEAGVPICLTSDGLKSPKELLAAVRTAVERGLAPEEALRALTTGPAALLGVSDRLGTLDAGKAAHLVVTDGDLLAKKTRVLETWVDGQRYAVARPVAVDVRGTWRVTPSAHGRGRFLLTIGGSPDKLEGTARPDRKDAKAAKLAPVELRDARFACAFDGAGLGEKGIVRLSAVVSAPDAGKITWSGSVYWPDGRSCTVRVEPAASPEPETAGAESGQVESGKAGVEPERKGSATESGPAVQRKALFPVNYPLGAFGRETPPEQPRLVLFRGATVWTCSKQGVLKNASVLIGRGKIIAVGRRLDAPAGAMVVDVSGKHITPGIIDCHSHIATDGGVNESGQAISAEVRIGDFIDATDVNIYRQLAGGVTTSHILHGSANPIGGQSQVIKLRWGGAPEELKFAEAPPTLKLALGENVKQSNWGDKYTSRYPQTRMGAEQIIRDAFGAAEEYERRRQQWNRTRGGLPPRRDLELDALVEVLRHKRWIHCHAYRQDEVLALLRLCEDFGVRVAALQHILEGYKVAGEIARHGAGASAFSDWWAYKFEVYDAIPYNGALMHRAGVVVSFNSDSAELARHLNQEAAKAVKYGGVAEQEALNFVTLNPARQLMIDRYVGSIEPGKHADLVVWNAPPLSNFAVCQQTWIDGRKHFDRREDLQQRRLIQQRREALVQKILAVQQKPAEPSPPKTSPAVTTRGQSPSRRFEP